MWERDGIRVLQPFDRHSKIDRNRLLNLLRVITANPNHSLPCARHLHGSPCSDPACCEGRSWLTPIDIIHAPHDDQYGMHIDTLLPSIKMYIYPHMVLGTMTAHSTLSTARTPRAKRCSSFCTARASRPQRASGTAKRREPSSEMCGSPSLVIHRSHQ